MTVFILEVMSLFQLLFLNTLLNAAIRISTRLHHNFHPRLGSFFCCCRAWKVWCERRLALVKWVSRGYCFWVLPPPSPLPIHSQKCSAELCTQTTLLKRDSDGWRKGGALVYTCSRLQRAQTFHHLEHGAKTWCICILVAMVDKTLW